MTLLRPARDMDAGAVGAILSAFIDDTDWMPRIHTRAEDLAHAAALIARGWVTVAEVEGRVAGFMAVEGEDLDALYIAESAQACGVGSALVNDLKKRQEVIELWTFQENMRAQEFYLKHGFVEIERTDGARNDEKLPDMRFVWRRATLGKQS